MQNIEWFENLNKPPLNPPDWIFIPVWIVLYILIAVSFIFFVKNGITPAKRLPLIVFLIQLALNFSWAPVFFGAQNIGAALYIVFFMWLFILFSVILFFRFSIPASVLLLPYLFWVSFAFYLNLAYFVLN